MASIISNKKAKTTHVNNYIGYTLPTSNTPVTRLSTPPDPQTFFDTYIKVRRPVIFNTSSTTTASSSQPKPWYHTFQKWSSNDYLKEVAGNATVRVETRTATGTAYGNGKYSEMTFSNFLDLQNSSTQHYLTTQNIEEDHEGRPAIMASPCIELANDFPLIPPLVGNLIPMNVNIWMGNGNRSRSNKKKAVVIAVVPNHPNQNKPAVDFIMIFMTTCMYFYEAENDFVYFHQLMQLNFIHMAR